TKSQSAQAPQTVVSSILSFSKTCQKSGVLNFMSLIQWQWGRGEGLRWVFAGCGHVKPRTPHPDPLPSDGRGNRYDDCRCVCHGNFRHTVLPNRISSTSRPKPGQMAQARSSSTWTYFFVSTSVV